MLAIAKLLTVLTACAAAYTISQARSRIAAPARER